VTGDAPIPAAALDYFARCRQARTEIEGWDEHTRRAARLVSIGCPALGRHQVGAVFSTSVWDAVYYIAGRWHWGELDPPPPAVEGHHHRDVRGHPHGTALLGTAETPADLPDAACPNQSCAFDLAPISTTMLTLAVNTARSTGKLKRVRTRRVAPT